MTDRATALAKASEWAKQAEACDKQRRTSLERARNEASSDYLRRQAAESYEEASQAETGRQRAVEMARMWTGIANVANEDGES